MERKKLNVLLLSGMISIGLLFGCSAEDEEDPATNEEPTEQQENETEGAPEQEQE
ncbi:hypothetical protein [Oceanobacillus senegalensis]|uniref:hypothetical protein n=1 Tax=Oceanobacillus senegalensis TaxID=1936063 RepID=UPI0015C4A252|nr:hypothetical protein [Oceanobacillus senegalensis]